MLPPRFSFGLLSLAFSKDFIFQENNFSLQGLTAQCFFGYCLHTRFIDFFLPENIYFSQFVSFCKAFEVKLQFYLVLPQPVKRSLFKIYFLFLPFCQVCDDSAALAAS